MKAYYQLRRITEEPGYHWFGYYDKLQFDRSGRFALGMKAAFEGRSPTSEDSIAVGMIDLHDGDRWIELGTTTAWCWQQGCMLQWIPGREKSVIWNDRSGDRYISRVLDVDSGVERELPAPIYAISPDGEMAVTADFRRINENRPGYGYAGQDDPNSDELAPDNSGIWRIDLETGSTDLILSIADVVSIPSHTGNFADAKHYFNHLLVNPDGSRFEFLHRWRFPETDGRYGGFHTRMMTGDPDGKNCRVVDDSGNTSHFIWKDSGHILAYTQPDNETPGFYLFNEQNGTYTCELDEHNNGHCLYLPGNQWILNDTYPLGVERVQYLYLYHVEGKRRVPLGEFPVTPEYTGSLRCDLHPRFSPDGSLVCFDSAHEGGRQLYLMDISEATGAAP